MTSQPRLFDLDSPAALIAALPAVLGFVPERSLVLVTVDRGDIGPVLRVDLSAALVAGTAHLAEVVAASSPDAAIAVVVDEDGTDCDACGIDHLDLADRLAESLDDHAILLLAVLLVDRVTPGGRWSCADGCGAGGLIDDPDASPLAAAAVLDGRRLYRRREDLQRVVGVADPARCAALRERIRRRDGVVDDEAAADAVRLALRMAAGVRADSELDDAEVATLAAALTDPRVKDTLYALAVGERAAEAEALWTVLARTLPDPWRVEALVLLAFSAYARGDGPLAGIALEAALNGLPAHRMAGMLDQALQSGMHPRQIRELALTGYRTAAQLGVRLPSRRAFGQRAG
ncbi:uncharacterized protein RMCC_2358 [Mycolicibacterium canariasense]|uniref:DUF4192 domain-containing protein n=1 Tax=Mycolicibacterium canariasense TaxID=228230 RepID=A0A100WBG1_MYCCR|nr:DUF4192 domain-containing protein [Mycolicibacterium canariasense]MCV7209084.1 DUF4192 domain-containing protein [Mycolicibacterium canariasense]ORV06161.1 hypothetical protein AWB94_19405 [Mycolicibacterium canariasense]GAS95392.1 uncharacterized protein RMCC_2358 [Mycolicibacterium canariasense]